MVESSITKIHELSLVATKIRKDIIAMVGTAASGHPGGSLSCADIIACLYFHEMRHYSNNPSWSERDHFVLSKGHSAPALYSALAECGYFDRSELNNLRKIGCMLQGHPDCNKTPGVEVATGSLGQGLSIANGIALGVRLDGIKSRVYCLLGDGELQEGQVWEAAMTAAHFKLNNVCAILDHNNLQIDGNVSLVMGIEPVADKWNAFGWNVLEIDAHNISQILNAFEQAKVEKNKPTIIIAKSVKGKGVSFMENNCDYHGKAPNADEMKKALEELDEVNQ